jgi:hypothetical protein
VEPDIPEPGRLAVVRFPAGQADSSAWTVGAAEFLSLASGSGIAGPGSREAEHAATHAPASGAVRAETEPEPGAPGLTVYRRRRVGDGAEFVDKPLPTCSAGPVPERGPTVGQEEPSEQEAGGRNGLGQDDDGDDDEFVMADLLNQDASVWGRRGPGSAGVLE